VLLTDLFMDLPPITHAQFVQENASSLDIYLVLNGHETDGLRDNVVQQVRSMMGPDVTLRVHIVPDIPRNPRSGKFQEVICKIEAPDTAGARRARETSGTVSLVSR
jgi:hypothetical protein